MTVKLTIGKEVELPTYKDVYEIEVGFMHGDADAYSTESCFYKPRLQFNEMKGHLYGLAFMRTPEYSGLYDRRLEEQALEQHLSELGMDKKAIDQFRDSFVQRDTTDGGYSTNARIDAVNIFYYDMEQKKFEVDVLVNDKPL
jgi:hypothetical protein